MVQYLPSSATRAITILTAEVGTTLTVVAPTEVIQGQPFSISGALRRVDTNQLLVGETISASFNGTLIGSDITGADGSYYIDAVINDVGAYTLTANFAGSTRPGLTLGSSKASIPIALGEITTPVMVLGVAVLGTVLIALSQR